eukprot:6208564-Pleurochrysis_carterae.AAC.3
MSLSQYVHVSPKCRVRISRLRWRRRATLVLVSKVPRMYNSFMLQARGGATLAASHDVPTWQPRSYKQETSEKAAVRSRQGFGSVPMRLRYRSVHLLHVCAGRSQQHLQLVNQYLHASMSSPVHAGAGEVERGPLVLPQRVGACNPAPRVARAREAEARARELD